MARILKKYGYNDLARVATPWPPKQALLALSPTHSVDTTNQHQYIVEGGALNHLIYSTRPDIAYTMSRLAEANQAPTEAHWKLLKSLWRYLGGTQSLGLMINGSGINLTPFNALTKAIQPHLDVSLHAYANTAFADRPGSRASIGAYIVTAASLPLIWKTKKQPLVTLSTTEAEFINLTPYGSSLVWINNILTEAGHP